MAQPARTARRSIAVRYTCGYFRASGSPDPIARSADSRRRSRRRHRCEPALPGTAARRLAGLAVGRPGSVAARPPWTSRCGSGQIHPARVSSKADRGLIVRATTFECRIRSVAVDLATELDGVVLPERCLVTACALLDLVSEDWLAKLASPLAERRCVCVVRLELRRPASTSIRLNQKIRTCVSCSTDNQLGDKGFGPGTRSRCRAEGRRDV